MPPRTISLCVYLILVWMLASCSSIQQGQTTDGQKKSERIRAGCRERHGASGRDYSRCMAAAFEAEGCNDLAAIWYQGIDDIKARQMILAHADKSMKQGCCAEAARIYQSFKIHEKAKRAWICQAEGHESKGQFLKAAAIYETSEVNEPDRARLAYFRLAEELEEKAAEYVSDTHRQTLILQEAIFWYEKAGKKDKANRIRRRLKAVTI